MTRVSKKSMLNIIKPFRGKITTTNNWDRFVTANSELKLPSSSTLRYHFSSWNALKVELELMSSNAPKNVREFDTMLTKGQCLKILKQYKEHLISTRQWDKFRRENKVLELPHSKEVSRIFGSWNDMKRTLGLELNSGGGMKPNIEGPLNEQKLQELQKKNEELIELLLPYKEYLITSRVWDTFRTENPHLRLPQSQKITKSFTSWIIMRQVLGMGYIVRAEKMRGKYLISTEEDLLKYKLNHISLIEMINPYKEHLITSRRWDSFREENLELNLPHSDTIQKAFHSWYNVVIIFDLRKSLKTQ